MDDEAHGYKALLLPTSLISKAKGHGLEGEADGLIEGDDKALAKGDTEGNFVDLLLSAPTAQPKFVMPVTPVETISPMVPVAPNAPAGPVALVSPVEQAEQTVSAAPTASVAPAALPKVVRPMAPVDAVLGVPGDMVEDKADGVLK